MDQNKGVSEVPNFEEEAPTTAARFPHVLSRLKVLWADAEGCEKYFHSLLIESRTDSQGFPVPVMLELMHLEEIFRHGREERGEDDAWSKHEPQL